jgi:hypothetical protein
VPVARFACSAKKKDPVRALYSITDIRVYAYIPLSSSISTLSLQKYQQQRENKT